MGLRQVWSLNPDADHPGFASTGPVPSRTFRHIGSVSFVMTMTERDEGM